MSTGKAILVYILSLGILGVLYVAVGSSSALGGFLIVGGFFYFMFKNSGY